MYNVCNADIIPDGWPHAGDGGDANYTIGLRLWYNNRKAVIIPDGWPHAEDGGDANYTIGLRLWYNNRKAVIIPTDAPSRRARECQFSNCLLPMIE